MARFLVKALPPAKGDISKWYTLVQENIPYMRVYSQSLDATSVTANSESTQTFTITGLETTDVIILNPPALEADLGIVYYRVSAKDTLQIRYRNFSGGNIDPAAGIYNIVSIRK